MSSPADKLARSLVKLQEIRKTGQVAIRGTDLSLLHAAVRSETLRLPEEGRPALRGVIRLVGFNQVSYRLQQEIKESGGSFSPTLRLISEIIRNNP